MTITADFFDWRYAVVPITLGSYPVVDQHLKIEVAVMPGYLPVEMAMKPWGYADSNAINIHFYEDIWK